MIRCMVKFGGLTNRILKHGGRDMLIHNSRHFSHAFADKTVAEQEAAIQSYITLFLQRISEANTQSLDICLLLNCLTFDIVGDLAFSQSFNALRDSKLHVCYVPFSSFVM